MLFKVSEDIFVTYNDSTTILEEHATDINVSTINQTQTTTTNHHHSGGRITQQNIIDIDCIEQIGSVTIIPKGCIYSI